MTKDTFTSAIEHSSDATFRAWGLALSTSFDTVGFTKSADTGQINWATVTRPGTTTAGGYEIRYFDDGLHATRPIYVKIEYGTGSVASYPTMWITVGTGSNGSGTITGTVFARQNVRYNSVALVSTVTTYPTYVCFAESCFWFIGWAGAHGTFTQLGFALMRTSDATGAPDDVGVVLYQGPNNGANYAAQASVYVFATTYAKSSTDQMTVYGGNYTLMPYGLTATVVSGVPGSFQATRHYTVTPTIQPMLQILSTSNTDAITRGTTFEATPIGATQHTYLSVGNMLSYYDIIGLIWE